jgi:rhodanese-related sulfurtransferase
MKSLELEDFKQQIEKENVVVVDVRRADEVSMGKITHDALEVDFSTSEFADNINSLDKEVSYALYCRSGGRSKNAMIVMQDLGFKDISHLIGGKNVWDADAFKV